MARDLANIDKDLAQTEKDLARTDRELDGLDGVVKDLKAALGNTAGGNSGKLDVAARLTKLENQSGDFTTRLDGVDVSIKELSKNLKEFRWLVLGLAASAQLVKLDMQVLKIDISAMKFDDKGFSRAPWFQKFTRSIGDLWDSSRKTERAVAERNKKDEDDKASKLKKTIDGLPPRVTGAEDDIQKARKDVDRAWKRAVSAQTEAGKAKRRAEAANRGIAQLRTQLRAAGAGADLGARQKGEFDKMRNSIQGLSQALAGI